MEPAASGPKQPLVRNTSNDRSQPEADMIHDVGRTTKHSIVGGERTFAEPPPMRSAVRNQIWMHLKLCSSTHWSSMEF